MVYRCIHRRPYPGECPGKTEKQVHDYIVYEYCEETKTVYIYYVGDQ